MSDSKPAYSIPSILALISALLSFYFGAILGLIFAALALIFGVMGILLALAPRTRGGGISILAVILSFIGVLAAIIKAIIWILSLF